MSNHNSGKKTFVSCSTKGTKALGRKAAARLVGQGQRSAALILELRGDLGGGKTTFMQGFAEGLAISDKIISPTFVIMKKFKLRGLSFKFLYHIDCYRLQKPEEILELGWQEIIADPANIVAVEWPERIGKFLPASCLRLDFVFLDKNKRQITINGKR
ncbi:MAG: tRNA (adenosine(37)-N6)-threonylcarbamoyltransferase complex ATPase subunit type 1 TsaE [Candidatus Pacebacteria bacterium]|nr:tRNA (adenosine(37)-N6)-threonylcarbamoyltransferase complex ATPase subunit type 1 TsaE [Candidatus Paceibacterota bacterium]